LSTPGARALVGRSRAGSALQAAHIDPEALTDTLVRAAQLVADHPEIVRLDLNPVLAAAGGVAVTDAEVRIAPDRDGHVALRRLD